MLDKGDDYGLAWLVSSRMSEELVTDLHAVNSSLVDNGFGPQLLCTLVAFTERPGAAPSGPDLPVQAGARSTRSPRCPASAGGSALQVKGAIGKDLKWESSLARCKGLGCTPAVSHASGVAGMRTHPHIIGIARWSNAGAVTAAH